MSAASTQSAADSRNAMSPFGTADGRARRRKTVILFAPRAAKTSALPGGVARRPDETKTNVGKNEMAMVITRIVRCW